MKLKTAVFVIVILLFLGITYFIVTSVNAKTEQEPKVSDFTYAIIYYPDMKTSIEGYIDNYIIYNDSIIQISIDDTKYLTDARNCIIIKKKSLDIKKED